MLLAPHHGSRRSSPPGSWVHATYTFGLFPRPEAEYIVVGSPLLAGKSIIVDQIDAAIRCIPEPAVIVMLSGLATMGLAGGPWRRRRCR